MVESHEQALIDAEELHRYNQTDKVPRHGPFTHSSGICGREQICNSDER